jgi:ubiquinone/menaquinone biosynthesis C-methylase UbiE
MLKGLVQRLENLRSPVMRPAPGYDLWSATYDAAKDNLVVALDEAMFEGLLQSVALGGKAIVDVGCGTGRHWSKLLARGPSELVGYDVSSGMLARLKASYPLATVHEAGADALLHTRDAGCDILVSTLALSHVAALEATFAEWSRVLRAEGHVLLTDFHPEAAARGNTSFRHGGRRVRVEVHARPLATVKAAAGAAGFEVLSLEERAVDASMRPHFERARMLRNYERMVGVPILYGMHLRKARPGPR